MKRLLTLAALTLSIFLTGTLLASAQVATNYWRLSTNTLKPNLNTWSLTIPQLGGVGTRCVQVDNNGLFSVAGAGCGSGGGGGTFPFSSDNNFGQVVYSTSTPTLWFKSGVFASSTSVFTFASTTALTAPSLFATNFFLGTDAKYTSLLGSGLSNAAGVLTVSGLATSNFTSAAISQWTNDSGYRAGSGTSGNCVQWGAANSLTDAGAACGTGGGGAGNWFTPTTAFGTAANATSTLTGFTAGLYALGSSTIGAAATTTGLTVNGMATTTGLTIMSQGGPFYSTILSVSNTPAFFSLPNQPGVGFLVGGSAIQTISNKTLSLTNNTINGGTAPNFLTMFANGATTTMLSIGRQAWFGGTATSTFTSTGALGVASTSPYATLSVHGVDGSANTTLFAIGSSTASATTTLISVSNLGTENVNLDAATTTIISLGGHQFLSGSASRQNVSLGVDTFTVDGSTQNVAIGYQTLQLGTNNGGNVAIGYQVAKAMQFGGSNAFVGAQIAPAATNVSNTVGIGFQSLFSLTSGSLGNTAIGYQALNKVTTASNNTAIGVSALFNATGDTNFGLGYQAGSSITTGFSNIIVGNSTNAGNLTTGGGNIGIGNNLFFPSVSANNQIDIGNFLFGTLPATTTALQLPTSGAIGVASTSPYAKLSIHTNNGDTATTLFAIGSSTATATTTLLNVSNVGALTTAGNILTSPAGSTLTSPRLVGFSPDFALGEAARYQIGADAIGLQAGFNQRLTAYTYWAMEIRGSRQTTSAAAFTAGASTDPSLIVYGATGNANNIANFVSNDGTVIFSVFNKQGNLGVGSSSPTTANAVVQNNYGSATTDIFSVASSTNSSGTLFSSFFKVTNAGSVGIGTTTPWSRLAIDGNGSIVVTQNLLATSTSMTVDWKASNSQNIRMHTAGVTVAFTNYVAGQTLRLTVCNGNGTSGSLTFSNTDLLWTGGSAPSKTTTANKCDVYSFLADYATSTLKLFGTQTPNF